MKKISLIILVFLCILNSVQAEENKMQEIDKLDVLDQQSRNFFKNITGLEKDYIEEQIGNINNKKTNNYSKQPSSTNIAPEPRISEEEYEKKVFEHQNEMARITSDFTRTKKLKDIKINSMYSFNGKSYVILKLDNTKTSSSKDQELSANIQGRYIKGDHILGHKIISINIRTKTVKLYKKIDKDYGYTIYLSNYGISVSDLEKYKKIQKKTEVKTQTFANNNEKSKSKRIKETFSKTSLPKVEKIKSEDISSCLYTVKVSKLNVRNSKDLNAKILRILKLNDQFTIKNRNDKWLHLDTIYKKISGDVMVVENSGNWVQISDINLFVDDKNCL